MENYLIDFGRNRNQKEHTFRHIEAAGLWRNDVIAAVSEHLWHEDQIIAEGPYTGYVMVKGVSLEFRAYKFSNGDIHVGRITLR